MARQSVQMHSIPHLENWARAHCERMRKTEEL
jgi:hypothetical protein